MQVCLEELLWVVVLRAHGAQVPQVFERVGRGLKLLHRSSYASWSEALADDSCHSVRMPQA